MRFRRLFVSLAGMGLASSVLTGAEPDLVHSELLRVVAQAPALSAASRRAIAARERAESAGRLADPQVEGMTSRMDGPMGDRSTMYELNVRQPLPKRGERAADRDRARAGVSMADADYALMMGEMAADTAMALAEAESAQARIRLLETQLGRLDAVLRSIEVRLAAGTNSRIADRLTVQSRIASMQLMIEQEQKMAADALSEARGRLGLLPDSPLPGYAAPSVDDIAVENAAALRLAVARSEEAVAMAKMARASANPMTAVGLRLERERTAMGDEDTIGVAFMSEIPWRSRRYARAEVRAAEAEHAAAQADGTAARYRISSAVTRVERAERLAETARRLSSETLGRLNAEYDSMVRAAGVAGSGESAVLQTVELLEKATDTELQVIQADLSARTARAELWRYLPTDRLPTPTH
jgi:cobalt-zinc-cadmium efflux system outer membrane protein